MMKLENFIVIGISHLEYDTEKRENFIKKNPEKFIENLKIDGCIEGYISVITCLRVEFYIDLGKNSLKDFLNTTKVKEFFKFEKIFFKSEKEAIKYLFKVSCGFYSIIKGEDQILAQIKKSYLNSLEKDTSSKLLNVVFNKGIELGKKFRTESEISHNALSLEAISLKFIKDSIDILENKKILILGIGDLAQSILHLLIKENTKNITITNRTEHKALEIKNIYKNVNVISFNKKNEAVIESDIIISATSAPHLVLKKEELENKIKTDKKYTFLDLAVPKDIDPQLAKLENIDLFNLDDVWNVYNKNVKNREKILKEYEFLIYEQIEKLEKWFQWKEKMETD
ncbi:glutamyl-tRNA reductase [Fusobacterium perfoetens]|uniref:glutamyl-tRNA reductase n=1 Tax=Fusobacterium perfoetens TaxID=852 RepID=UPI000485726C|nr:glutamyl-tRNA reductase [Fusobacterium perfoetens]MCI6152465.1 glutamyl-tRNA reductase [Fusobacterium perfoetens]MDY3237719.1 glutamyl-tRNA reductase [Fusobacterium perfoetens]